MNLAVNTIANRLSFHLPQWTSLEILERIYNIISKITLKLITSDFYCLNYTVKISLDFYPYSLQEAQIK